MTINLSILNQIVNKLSQQLDLLNSKVENIENVINNISSSGDNQDSQFWEEPEPEAISMKSPYAGLIIGELNNTDYRVLITPTLFAYNIRTDGTINTSKLNVVNTFSLGQPLVTVNSISTASNIDNVYGNDNDAKNASIPTVQLLQKCINELKAEIAAIQNS